MNACVKKTTRSRKSTADVAVKAEPKKKRVVLSVKAEPGSTVYVAGSFNEWNPTDKKLVDKKGDGIFTATIILPPGIYEYKFVINGVWTLDPDPDRDWTQNGLGTLNSVLRVG
ncbi:MAG: glycogen-binding domain-containing protein [Kiritimatiellae bacterium]|jgi:1,4-alpha-glucan branching enzyme|nr:glycogen-binding domain-containing protein [Kiritimatiellia bacterium]